ncbi:MAG: DNA mismatch repair endonuclease MutL [Candidatus Eisenbacteria bacterium]|nr:DNA mismatch repair endonuclease MutL [Candidatus Eisenbacteria bacterium]
MIASGRIKLLPPDLVQLIAAGEVVERPLSVVKELVENSLDAGARNIWVEIEGSPDAHLLVSDDGEGMSREEAVLAFERHSTSKISESEDLDRIVTFGFRGEALPSIASVARVKLTTLREGDQTGCEIELEGGKALDVRDAGRGKGTSVLVRDLFFNTPARRKFLKTVRSEMKAIAKLITAFSLTTPACAFYVVHNGRKTLTLPPAQDLRERMTTIFGERTVDSMVELLPGMSGVELRGFLGKPELSRNSAEHIYIFVNSRWIQSALLMKALKEGYRDLIPRDRYPMAVISLIVDPAQVDVNVHPSKREIRFKDERLVFETVRGCVRQSLSPHGTELPAGEHGWIGHETWIGHGGEDKFRGPGVRGHLRDGGTGENRGFPYESRPDMEAGISFVRELLTKEGGEESPKAETDREDVGLVNLWQLHGTYILGETKGGLVLIDQHAAHERILYEHAMGSFKGQDRASQQLLFPLVLDFAKDEFENFLEMSQWLKKLGFDLVVFGERTVLVRGIPSSLRRWDEGQALRDIVDFFSEDSGDEFPPEEKAARAFACCGAVNAGEVLNQQEMNWLINALFLTKVPDGDPHGRPTFIRVSLAELEKRFGRR